MVPWIESPFYNVATIVNSATVISEALVDSVQLGVKSELA